MHNAEYSPTKTDAWGNLESLALGIKSEKITDFFEQEPDRLNVMSLAQGEFFLDFSKNLISQTVWIELLALARESNLIPHREAMLVNQSM